jgi:hypothetical protein
VVSVRHHEHALAAGAHPWSNAISNGGDGGADGGGSDFYVGGVGGGSGGAGGAGVAPRHYADDYVPAAVMETLLGVLRDPLLTAHHQVGARSKPLPLHR